MSNSIKDAHVNGKPKGISVVGNETLKAVNQVKNAKKLACI